MRAILNDKHHYRMFLACSFNSSPHTCEQNHASMFHRLAESPCSSFNHVFSMIDLANLAKNSAVGIKCRTLRHQFELEIWHFGVLICMVQVPWEDLCYLFGEIIYGGHITDEWDRKLCRTYLQEFINPKMVKTFRALQYTATHHTITCVSSDFVLKHN